MKFKFLILVLSALNINAYSQSESDTSRTQLTPNDQECLVKFVIVDPRGIPEEGAVVRADAVDNKFSKKAVADIDGKCEMLIPEGSSFKVVIEKFNSEFDFGVQTIAVKPGSQIANFKLSIELVTTYRRVYTLRHLFFGPSEYEVSGLKRESLEDLDKLADSLNINKKMKVEIAGHTDNSGDAKINLHLSQKRADSVREYLINKGIEPDRLLAKGYGSTSPISSNDTPEGRSFNRRTEVKVIEE